MSAYTQSPCGVRGCHRMIPRWRTMCDTHWGMVPHHLQRRVVDIGHCLRLEIPEQPHTRQEYDLACREALRYVTELVTPPQRGS